MRPEHLASALKILYDAEATPPGNRVGPNGVSIFRESQAESQSEPQLVETFRIFYYVGLISSLEIGKRIWAMPDFVCARLCALGLRPSLGSTISLEEFKATRSVPKAWLMQDVILSAMAVDPVLMNHSFTWSYATTNTTATNTVIFQVGGMQYGVGTSDVVPKKPKAWECDLTAGRLEVE